VTTEMFSSSAASSWLGPYREAFAYGTAVKLRRG
jgi:hypothetical protein